MADFIGCVRAAQRQGALTEAEADALVARHQHWKNAHAAAGRVDPEALARASIIDEQKAAAARKRFLTALQAEKIEAIKHYLTGFRDLSGSVNVFEGALNLLENFGGGAGTSSIANRYKAVVGLSHARMEAALNNFRRSRLTGQRFNKPDFDNVVREMLGQDTGKPEAKAFAQAIADEFEQLRLDFNRGGGDIGRIEGGYIPQFHNPAALLAAKYPAWEAAIKPRLDLDRMVDPSLDLPFSSLPPERLDRFLKATYENVVTEGMARKEPSMQATGKGAVANQRAEHRYIHFKTADDWLEYNRDFGSGDAFKTVLQHVNGMARDIAAMDVLGPNPTATVEWLKQVTEKERANRVMGQPSLFKGINVPDEVTVKYMNWRLDSVYAYVRGRESASDKFATGAANVRNVLTSVQLGSTSVLAATTDPAFDLMARYMAGMPMSRALYALAYAFKSEATRAQAVRSGLIWDDFMHIVGDEARYVGTLSGSEWSRWLADRTVNLTGLEPITQARKHIFGLDFQAMVADNADLTWAQLQAGARKNRYFHRAMESYGFTEREWDTLRATTVFDPDATGAGWIQPADVRDRDVAKRYLEMIYGETERAVPTGTARSRSLLLGRNPRGTFSSEIMESGLQYKSFGLSLFANQLQAVKQESKQGIARGAGYAASLIGMSWLGGALAMQLRNIAAGKDMQPMDASTGQGRAFWAAALQAGGGFGILGDFVLADQNRFGHSLAETLLGPTVSLADDVGKFVIGGAQKVIGNKDTHLGREGVRLAGRYTPLLGSGFYTRVAYQRMVIDQLQYLADPEAHKYFRQQQQKLRNESGQRFWWRPGQIAPDRFPGFSEAKR